MQKPPHETGATVPGDGRIPSGPVPRFSVFHPQAAFKSASGRKRPQLAGFCVKMRRMSNCGAPNADFFSLSFGGCAAGLRAGPRWAVFSSRLRRSFLSLIFSLLPPFFFFPDSSFFSSLWRGKSNRRKTISSLTWKNGRKKGGGARLLLFPSSPSTHAFPFLFPLFPHTRFPQPFPSALPPKNASYLFSFFPLPCLHASLFKKAVRDNNGLCA